MWAVVMGVYHALRACVCEPEPCIEFLLALLLYAVVRCFALLIATCLRCRYFVVALALSTGCSVFGIELVQERHEVAQALLAVVWQAISDAVQLPEDCGQPDCFVIRARLGARMHKLGVFPRSEGPPVIDFDPDDDDDLPCLCSLLAALPNVHTLLSRVLLVCGNALCEDLPLTRLQRAKVVYCNNYHGYWERDSIHLSDGSLACFQDLIRDRILAVQVPGAWVVL